MDVLIIEDELPAQQILVRLIKQYFSDFNIIGALDSVKAAARYLQDKRTSGVRSSSPPHMPTTL